MPKFKKRKKNLEHIDDAIDDFINNRGSGVEISQKYGITRNTLYYYMYKKQSGGKQKSEHQKTESKNTDKIEDDKTKHKQRVVKQNSDKIRPPKRYKSRENLKIVQMTNTETSAKMIQSATSELAKRDIVTESEAEPIIKPSTKYKVNVNPNDIFELPEIPDRLKR